MSLKIEWLFLGAGLLPYAAFAIAWAVQRAKRRQPMPAVVVPLNGCPLCREARRFDRTYVCDDCRAASQGAIRHKRRRIG